MPILGLTVHPVQSACLVSTSLFGHVQHEKTVSWVKVQPIYHCNFRIDPSASSSYTTKAKETTDEYRNTLLLLVLVLVSFTVLVFDCPKPEIAPFPPVNENK